MVWLCYIVYRFGILWKIVLRKEKNFHVSFFFSHIIKFSILVFLFKINRRGIISFTFINKKKIKWTFRTHNLHHHIITQYYYESNLRVQIDAISGEDLYLKIFFSSCENYFTLFFIFIFIRDMIKDLRKMRCIKMVTYGEHGRRHSIINWTELLINLNIGHAW